MTIMCLASIPGDNQTKENVKIYSRHELFRIGKDFKTNNITALDKSAVFKNVHDLGLVKQRGHRKRNFRQQSGKKHQIGVNVKNLIPVSANRISEQTPVNIHFKLINARSIRANLPLVQTQFLNDPAIVAITETWINTENDSFYVDEITPTGYKATI